MPKIMNQVKQTRYLSKFVPFLGVNITEPRPSIIDGNRHHDSEAPQEHNAGWAP